MNQDHNQNPLGEQPASQQQSLGDVQVQGDDNTLNVIQAQHVTLTQTKIIQISVDEIKTRKLIVISPYKGLRKFEPEDTDRFFGRDQFLGGLVNELEQTNLILLLGASGSGKSSVVRAGLIPWLSQKYGNEFVNLMLTPDRDPFESLYGSLLGRYGQSQAQLAKAGKVDTLSQVVKELKKPGSFWFIFIDQFEELFTVSEAEKRDCFIRGLVQLSKEHANDQWLKIVATMRADFLDRLDPAPANLLARITEKHRPLITQMQPDELRLAIEQPAAHHGVVFETGLVEEIIKEVQGQAGYLPLLQYTLDLLWGAESQKDSFKQERTLKLDSYRLRGGVRGALQKQVDKIYEELSQSEQLAAQRIFLKLVKIGGDEASGTEWKPLRQRTDQSEFQDEQEKAVLTQLIKANLLVGDAPVAGAEKRSAAAHGSTVEIAHEILLTSWTTLNTWIQKNRQSIALRNRLNDDVLLWRAKKADSDLWNGSRLEQVLEIRSNPEFKPVLGGFSDAANEFINASVGLRDRRRRQVIKVLSIVLIVVSVSLCITLYQWRNAEIGQIKALSESSKAKFTSNRSSFDALLDALKAGIRLKRLLFSNRETQLNADVMTALTESVFWVKEKNRLEGHSDVVNSLSFSPDGSTIASASADGTIKLWQRDGQLNQTLEVCKELVASVSFSPDGQILASGGYDGTVRLWNKKDGTWKEDETWRQKLNDSNDSKVEKVYVVSFSRDGQLLAAGGGDGTMKIWQLDGKLRVNLKGNNDKVLSLKFNLKGDTIAISSDKTVKLWRWQENNPLIDIDTSKNKQIFTSVDFSPDGQILASGSSDGTIKLWQLNGNQKTLITTLTFDEHCDEKNEDVCGVRSVSFSPDGKTLASGGQDNTVKLWQWPDRKLPPTLLTTLTGHSNYVVSVSFSPDGQALASASNDNTIKLWNLNNQRLTVLNNDTSTNSVSFSPNTRILAAANGNTVKFWKTDGSLLDERNTDGLFPDKKKVIFKNENRTIAFSQNGQLFASAGYYEDNNNRSKGQINVWKLNDNGIPLSSAPISAEGENEFTSVSFNPNNQMIATADVAGKVQLWRVDLTRLTKPTPKEHERIAYAVSFSPDGKILASSGADGFVNLSKTDETPIQSLKDSEKKPSVLQDVRFSSDNQMIAIASKDGSVKLWEINGTSVKLKNSLRQNSSLVPVTAVSFNPKKSYLASANEKGEIFLWKRDGTLITKLTGHSKYVESLSFSPDGNILASGSDDKNTILWNLDDPSNDNLSLDHWLTLGCSWMQDYLKTKLIPLDTGDLQPCTDISNHL